MRVALRYGSAFGLGGQDLHTPRPPRPRAPSRTGWRLSSVPAEWPEAGDAVAWLASPLRAEPSLEDRDGDADLGRLGEIAVGQLGVHG